MPRPWWRFGCEILLVRLQRSFTCRALVSAGVGEPATSQWGSMLGTSTSWIQGHKSCIFRTSPCHYLLKRCWVGDSIGYDITYALSHLGPLADARDGLNLALPNRLMYRHVVCGATSRFSSGLHVGRLLSSNTHYVGRRLTQFPQDSQQSITVDDSFKDFRGDERCVGVVLEFLVKTRLGLSGAVHRGRNVCRHV